LNIKLVKLALFLIEKEEPKSVSGSFAVGGSELDKAKLCTTLFSDFKTIRLPKNEF
jgi:hypothetical protein